MDESRKIKIRESFPAQFETADLGVTISFDEFQIFNNGIYSYSMDDKWNVFVLNEELIFSRSWTDHCIYIIQTEQQIDLINLKKILINRDTSQYRFTDVESDIINVKKLIQGYLNRDDIYSDPKLELELIKKIIKTEGIDTGYKKSIDSATVSFTIYIYNTLISPPNDSYFITEGWKNLEKNLLKMHADENIISLYIQHKQNGSAKRYYFNNDASKYLGVISISQINKKK